MLRFNSLRILKVRSWSTVIRRSVSDFSKQPTLNQFQNPQNPPNHFQNSSSSPSDSLPPPVNQNSPSKWSRTIRSLIITSPLLFLVYIAANSFNNSGIVIEDISKEFSELVDEAIELENKGKIDEAIEAYLKMLNQLDEEKRENISFNYTATALRIAQLYEFEKKFDKSLAIYKELSEMYLNVIMDEENFDSKIGKSTYDTALLCSLAIASRYAQLLPKTETSKAKKILLINIVQAHRRIILNYSPFLSVLNDITNRNILSLISTDLEKELDKLDETHKELKLKEASKNPLELPLYSTDQTEENMILGFYREGWPIFTRALCDAKDVYSNICIEDDDLSEAVSNLTNNAIVMQRSSDIPSKVSINLAKLAVVLQMSFQKINSDFPFSNEEIEVTQENSSVNKIDINAPAIKDFVLTTTMHESERIFSQALKLTDRVKSLPNPPSPFSNLGLSGQVGKFDNLNRLGLEKAEMISSVGLGLIGFKNENYEDSLKYFQRAKVLAVKLKDDDYVDDITGWIQNIENKV